MDKGCNSRQSELISLLKNRFPQITIISLKTLENHLKSNKKVQRVKWRHLSSERVSIYRYSLPALTYQKSKVHLVAYYNEHNNLRPVVTAFFDTRKFVSSLFGQPLCSSSVQLSFSAVSTTKRHHIHLSTCAIPLHNKRVWF